jgi:hypothetical protein
MGSTRTDLTMLDHRTLVWHRSSASSSGSGAECVEAATTAGAVLVRDSKHCTGPILMFPSSAWADFIDRTPEA